MFSLSLSMYVSLAGFTLFLVGVFVVDAASVHSLCEVCCFVKKYIACGKSFSAFRTCFQKKCDRTEVKSVQLFPFSIFSSFFKAFLSSKYGIHQPAATVAFKCIRVSFLPRVISGGN